VALRTLGSARPQKEDTVIDTALPDTLKIPKHPEPALDPASAHAERAGLGLGLSSLYGLALGAREGGQELLRHALGVPLSLLVLGAVLMPSLTVLLSLLDAPVTPITMLRAVTRAVSSAGFVLAGLAPSAAVLVVTIDSPGIATAVARGFGFIAGSIGLVALLAGVRALVSEAKSAVIWKTQALLMGYSMFAILLGCRLFALLVPMIGGAS
jgi:hypothetical protein